MNRREIKRHLLRSIAEVIEADLAAGGGYIQEGDGEPDWNAGTAEDLIEELADEFRRRGEGRKGNR